MIKKLKKHTIHYSPLFFIIAITILGFMLFSFNRQMQAILAFSSSFSYFLWGVYHHYKSHDLYLEVIIEYLAFSLLGFIILFSLVLRA